MSKIARISCCTIALVALTIWVPHASAYQFYSEATNDVGGCAQCHTGFRDNSNYVSQAEGFAWGTSLHNAHLNNTNVGSNCGNCHFGAGTAGRTVNLSSSEAAADGVNAIACSGCHGRLEDANNVTQIGTGWGAGLRQHHYRNGVMACLNCHADANPDAFTPAGEDIMPPWYASVLNTNTGTNLAPCNANLEEDLSGDPLNLGLDNDGDLDYDGNDPDCQAAVCGNSIVEVGEDCDDGNTLPGDCCSDTCQFEPSGSSCADGLFCNGDETCDGLGSCQAGTAVDCSDGVDCTDDSCDEAADACVNTANDANCPNNGLFCDGTEFCDPGADCSSTGDPCATGTVCNETTNTCDPIAACGNGILEPGEECDDGNILPGDCCSDTCQFEPSGSSCADGEYCNGDETCNGAGVCQSGTPVDCNDGVDCTTDDLCDEVADACVNTPDNTFCDDGQFCNGIETCDAVNDCQPGMPVDCSDGVGCTDDSCDEGADECVNTANDTNCPDDGLFCNGAEFCDAQNDCSSTGDPCQTGEVCNEATDTCDPIAACGNGIEEPGEECDDGNTQPGDCCSATCTFEAVGSPCADADFCNGVETCDGAGTCAPGTPVDCDDGVACTIDSCDEVNDGCVNTPNDNNCPDDGLFCSGQEICDPVDGCVSTGNPCPGGTVCNEATDVCDSIPICGNGIEEAGEECDDGNTQPGDCCSATCTFEATGSSCADGEYCNGDETCDGAGTCVPGTPVVCDDGVNCTIDACDEAADACVSTPDNAFCDDGQFCNGVEICDVVADCQPGTPIDCSDGVGCTDDSCDETADACVNTPNDANCPDNGLFCDGMEICDAQNDCASTGDPCPAGTACNETGDLCEEVCVPTANKEKGKKCSDGIDNDCDGQIDSDDPDCAGGGGGGGAKGEGKGKTCRDGIDNDGDTLIDCADPDCANSRDCP